MCVGAPDGAIENAAAFSTGGENLAQLLNCKDVGFSRTPARLRLRPTRGAPSAAVGDALVASHPDPNEAVGKPGMGDPIAPAGRAAARLESSTASFPSCEVASHALAASRADPNEAIGKTSVGDHKGRPYTRTTRPRGPRRGDPCGRPYRRTRAVGLNEHGRPQGSNEHGRPQGSPQGRPYG